MAKHTVTFADYLGGHELPPEFEQLGEDFKSAFVGHYCDSEIGFETETLFEIKLNTTATRVIPLYAAQKARLDAAKTAADTPTYKRVSTLKDGDKTTKNWVLPVDQSPEVAEVSPNNVQKYTSGDDETTETITGFTAAELKENVKFYERRVYDLYMECIKEFSNLFLQIY